MATTLDYINIPHCATRLTQPPPSASPSLAKGPGSIKRAPKITTSLPPARSRTSFSFERTSSPTPDAPLSPGATLYSNAVNLMPQMLLAGLPQTKPGAGVKKDKAGKITLLSTRDPISLPIMTNNFKRFVSIVGPIFWVQDRVEEILLWKRGFRVSATWMGIYVFLCLYPRLLFVLPLVGTIALVLATNSQATTKERQPKIPEAVVSDPSVDVPRPGKPTAGIHAKPVAPPSSTDKGKEASIDYSANIQGIQNLMGFGADLNDTLAPYMPLLTYSSSSTQTRASVLLLVLCVLVGPSAVLVLHPAFPARFVTLLGGVVPWALCHPDVQAYLQDNMVPFVKLFLWNVATAAEDPHAPYILRKLSYYLLDGSTSHIPQTLDHFVSTVMMKLVRLLDDDRLDDRVWASEVREVELFENERLGSSDGEKKGWSKENLSDKERGPWTRGRDGWSSVGDSQGHVSSNLTFSLSPNWSFVPTEDWRKDVRGDWIEGEVDRDGWSYTNDAWLNPVERELEGKITVTRRRRWTRRVWFDVAGSGQ
ncbi:integral peroxisomal membrane peroxin-domain-containing protein [Flagelloscypha sp. PMI_526]|nr:integral peroxisomal membrane peroxin-domain-containing protein [Flagelloscypha sp. PMI_526]